MAILDAAGSDLSSIERGLWEAIKPSIAKLAWTWFDQNRDQEIYTVKKWVFSFTVRVSMARPILVALFGDDPTIPA